MGKDNQEAMILRSLAVLVGIVACIWAWQVIQSKDSKVRLKPRGETDIDRSSTQSSLGSSGKRVGQARRLAMRSPLYDINREKKLYNKNKGFGKWIELTIHSNGEELWRGPTAEFWIDRYMKGSAKQRLEAFDLLAAASVGIMQGDGKMDEFLSGTNHAYLNREAMLVKSSIQMSLTVTWGNSELIQVNPIEHPEISRSVTQKWLGRLLEENREGSKFYRNLYLKARAGGADGKLALDLLNVMTYRLNDGKDVSSFDSYFH